MNKKYLFILMTIIEYSKNINLIGLLIWLILYWILIPFKMIKKYPAILIGYFYTVFILFCNYNLIGNELVNYQDEVDFKLNNSYEVASYINNKAVQVSTAIFALAIAAKDLFNKDFQKELLIFMSFTLIFGVAMILPIYFISNYSRKKQYYFNVKILRIRNVFLSYSVGFMVSGLILSINRIFTP